MLIKLLFFSFFAALAAYVPYIALYFQRIGIPGSFIGVLLSINPVTETVATPLWGMLADARGWQRGIFLFCALMASLLAPLYIFASSLWSLVLLQMLLFAMICPLMPIVNRVVLDMQYREEADYGQSRVFGCLGFALSALGIGVLAETYGLAVMFWGTSFFMLVLFAGGLFFPAIETNPASRFREDLQRLIAHRRLLYFLGSVVLVRTGVVAASTYFGILMDFMGAGEGIMGFAWSGGALIEIPIFFFSTLLLIKLGVGNVLLLAYVLTLLQILLYLLVATPVGGLIVHISRGLFFSTFYIAGINFIQRQVPEEVQTTGQTLFAASCFGLAGALGNFLGGVVYQQLSIHAVYYFAALMAVLGTALFALVVYVRRDTEASSGHGTEHSAESSLEE